MEARVGDAAAIDRRRFLATGASAAAGGLLLRGAATGASAVLLSGSPAWASSERAGRAGRHEGTVLDEWFGVLYDACRLAGDKVLSQTPRVVTPNVTPGRAARVYATCAVAAYEAITPSAPHLRSLAGQLRDLGPGPRRAGADVHPPLVVAAAIHAAARRLFSDLPPERSNAFDEQLERDTRHARGAVSETIVQRSLTEGAVVGRHVATWAETDGSAAHPVGSSYTPPSGPGMWRSTPPNFGPAIDPYWGGVRTMALPAPVRAPTPHIPFSTEEGSPFFLQAQAVIDHAAPWESDGQPRTADQRTAVYWRDNPGESGLPSGHWNRIVTQVALDAGWSLPRATEVLAVTAIALHDAFVSCWYEKYESTLLRPISYINDVIDPGWKSFVNTPQFPEFTSGHSVASQAAATVLTSVAGVFEFTDRTHLRTWPLRGTRTFGSWQAAADEAATSRLQGGIHYPMGITLGMDHGDLVGRTVLARVRTR